jgi:hypothetical protein
MGVGLARPILSTETATVEYLTIKSGNSTTSTTVFTDLPNQTIKPRTNTRRECVQTLYFRNSFQLEPETHYAIAFKLRGCRMVYKGNPKARVDICIGADNTIWEFSEPDNSEAQWYING